MTQAVNRRRKIRAACHIDGTLYCAWCDDRLNHSFIPHPVGGGRWVPLHSRCHERHNGRDLLQVRALEYLQERGL